MWIIMYLKIKFSTKIFFNTDIFLKGTIYWIVLCACVHNANHGGESFSSPEIHCIL